MKLFPIYIPMIIWLWHYSDAIMWMKVKFDDGYNDEDEVKGMKGRGHW